MFEITDNMLVVSRCAKLIVYFYSPQRHKEHKVLFLKVFLCVLCVFVVDKTLN